MRSRPNKSTGCYPSNGVERIQPFPQDGTLAGNLNLSLKRVASRIRKSQGRVFTYVLSTVRLNRLSSSFEQIGSAPNFQGDRLTLCTCKHRMRATMDVEDWQSNVWVAGFTSRTIRLGVHWLFYLAKVESAYESHADLWNSLDQNAQFAKAAHVHYLGDNYVPKSTSLDRADRYSPSRYYLPSFHAHRKSRADNSWRNDINYIHADRFKRQPALLLFEPQLTFLWTEPKLHLQHEHVRDYRKWDSLQDVVAALNEGNR